MQTNNIKIYKYRDYCLQTRLAGFELLRIAVHLCFLRTILPYERDFIRKSTAFRVETRQILAANFCQLRKFSEFSYEIILKLLLICEYPRSRKGTMPYYTSVNGVFSDQLPMFHVYR